MLSQKKIQELAKKVFLETRIWDGAAALSFYIVMSLFPTVLILLASSSLLFDFSPVNNDHTSWWVSYLPSSVEELLRSVVLDISSSNKSLSLLSVGFLVAAWSSSTGMAAVMRQLNQIHHCKEKRSTVKIRLVALGISMALGVLFISSFLLMIVGQFLVNFFVKAHLIPADLVFTLTTLRILTGAVVFYFGFSLIYLLGPSARVKWKEIWPGGLVGTAAFLVTSQFYIWYLGNAGGYTATYGSLGATIGLIMWLYLLSFFLLLGAEINDIWAPSATVPSKKKGSGD